MATLVFDTIKPSSGDTVAFADCNVSVGGTVSYEDVTNIDSLGIVTARGGIEVGASGVGGTITATGDATLPGGLNATGGITATGGLNAIGILTARGGIEVGASGVGGTITSAGDITLPAGLDVTGIVTATSFSGDGSNLSGIEVGSANFVASGAISNGATVILKDDGTVGIVTQTTSDAPSAGTPVEFDGDSTNYVSAVSVGSSKIVIAYKDQGNSSYGTAIVGTVSGDTISFGTAVVFESTATNYSTLTYDSTEDKVIIAYSDSSVHGKAIVGTVSGDAISFGSAVAFKSASSSYPSIASIGSSKVVIGWRDGSNSGYGTAIVGTVSGTSISFGSEVVFESSATYLLTVTSIGSSKVVISYREGGTSYFGTGASIVGTVSGTVISFGTSVAFNVGKSYYLGPRSSVYDPDEDKIVIAYQDGDNSSYGTAIVGTVVGTAITFGSAVVFESGTTNFIHSTYDTATNRVVICYEDDDNSDYATAVVGTVSGTSIGFGDPAVIASTAVEYPSPAYDSDSNKVVVAYADDGNSMQGKAIVLNYEVTNLTTENYIGIAGEAISNAATGKINIIGGVNSGQSGLTTDQTYYISQSGILTTTADTPSVVAGTSISDTKILVWKS